LAQLYTRFGYCKKCIVFVVTFKLCSARKRWMSPHDNLLIETGSPLAGCRVGTRRRTYFGRAAACVRVDSRVPVYLNWHIWVDSRVIKRYVRVDSLVIYYFQYLVKYSAYSPNPKNTARRLSDKFLKNVVLFTFHILLKY